jgi:hypothetical protein
MNLVYIPRNGINTYLRAKITSPLYHPRLNPDLRTSHKKKHLGIYFRAK